MIKNKINPILLIVIIFQISCKKENALSDKDVVINELMAVNSTVVADQNGEYDDWIELFNLSFSEINLSGYYLSDSKSNVLKWKFPQGVTIPANGYLIIWADNDTTQNGLHTNFKLSSDGETVLLSKIRFHTS